VITYNRQWLLKNCRRSWGRKSSPSVWSYWWECSLPCGRKLMRERDLKRNVMISDVFSWHYLSIYLLSWRQCSQTATNVNINLLFMIIAWLWASNQIWPNSLLQSVSLWPLDMQADESGRHSLSSDIIFWMYIQADDWTNRPTLLCLLHLKHEMRLQSKLNHCPSAQKLPRKAEGFCKEHCSFRPNPQKVLRFILSGYC